MVSDQPMTDEILAQVLRIECWVKNRLLRCVLLFNSWLCDRLVFEFFGGGANTAVPASLGCGRASSSLLQFTVVVLFSVLLYYYSTFTFRCHVMGFSVLEVVGFTAIVSLTVFVLNELWKFLYTTRIGYALGKTISLKDIGEWASKFSLSFTGLNRFSFVTDDLVSIGSCYRCYWWYWPSLCWRGGSRWLD